MKKILILLLITVLSISIISCSKTTKTDETTSYAILIDGSQLKADREEELELLVNEYEATNNIELLPGIINILYLDGGRDKESFEAEYIYYKAFFDNIFTSEYLQDYYEAEKRGYYEYIRGYLLGCYFLGYDWYGEIEMFEENCKSKYYMIIGICQFISIASNYMITDEMDICLDVITRYEEGYHEYDNTEPYLYIYGVKKKIYSKLDNVELYDYYNEKWSTVREAIIHAHDK